MSKEDGNEDRLTKTEFAELIQHLPMQEIIAIEYRVGQSWSKLFTRKSIATNIFVCNLCSVETSSFKNLLAHIDGRKHKLQMERVQQLYHSQYTYPKIYKKESEIAAKSNSNKNVTTLLNNATVKNIKNTSVNSGCKNITEEPVVDERNSKNVKPSKDDDAKPISKTLNASNIIKTKEVPNCAKAASTNLGKETKKIIVKSPIENKSSIDLGKAMIKTTILNKQLNTSSSSKTVSTIIEKGKNNAKSTIDGKSSLVDDKCRKITTTALNNVITKNCVLTEPKTVAVALDEDKTNSVIANASKSIELNNSAKTASVEKNDNINQEKQLTKSTPPSTEELMISNKKQTSEHQTGQLKQTEKHKSYADTRKEKPLTEKSTSTTTVRVTTNTKNDINGQSEQTTIGRSTTDNLNLNKSQESIAKETAVSSSLVKNPFSLKATANLKPKNDDKKDNEAFNDSETTVSVSVESSLKIIEKIPSNATEGKRSLASDGSDNKGKGYGATEAKKAKIVINPASVLSEKNSCSNKGKARSQENVEKPQYQTDKIIIPTKHKPSTLDKGKVALPRAIATSASASSLNKSLPKFSVKTYSSKPSENDVQGVLGVEYVIKILKSRADTSPRYECGLCELVLDGYAMQRHLEGYIHRLKFCEKHFPTAIRHYRQYMHSVPEHELFKVMTPVLSKLAIAIEQHHGRNLPYECFERDFSLNRHEILAKAFSCRHASEQYGPTFTHVVGAKEIDDYINERHKYIAPTTSRTAIFDSMAGNSNRSDTRHSDKDTVIRDRHRHAGRGEGVSTMSSLRQVEMPYKSYMSSTGYSDVYPPLNAYSQLQPVASQPIVKTVDDETHKLMVEDFLKGTLKGISGERSRDNRKRSGSPTYSSSSAKRKSLSPLRQNDIWQAYRHMVDQELNNLDERFKQYRKDPETHPSYNEEWQKFWKRRKDELIAAGLDHRKYNYQPEWVRFIKIRVEELYGQEVENLKIRSRGRLCLPMTNNNLSDVRYHVQAPSMNAPEIVNVTSNAANDASALNNAVSAMTSNAIISSKITGTPQVVSVLRLMTALEENLGSLGPKIIDLLSKALHAEKTNPAQVNAIILNNENCSLVETAKEKLKGLVMAGLFEGSKNRLLKKVVKETELLLNYAQQLQHTSVQSAMHTLETNISLASSGTISAVANVINQFKHQTSYQSPVGQKTSSSIGTLLTQMDKKELASKLAASLVAQGKTDFDPQQLQQLIAVYTLIEKKKRTATSLSNKGIPMFTTGSSNKKNLSDMLSELLKSSSSTSASQIQGIDNSVSKLQNNNSSKSSESTYQGAGAGVTSNSNEFYQRPFSNATVGGGYPSNSSFMSASQNSGGNYFSNTTQSTDNAIGVSGPGGGLPVGRHGDYGFFPHFQQNQTNPNQYNNNLYQNNNNMAQNWSWNPNMGTNQNFNMGGGGPSDTNQSTNWRNF